MMREHPKLLFTLSAVLTLVLSSLLFLLLYHFDNKYQRPDPQATAGYLALSENDLAKSPAVFLRDGWLLYPDVLLTPEELTDGSLRKAVSVSAGQYSNFSLGDNARSPHGCGSYVMHLRLPDAPATYALELPEIYSAYHLYINGAEVVSCGAPEAKNYRDVIRTRTVTFTASGNVTLLLSVADYTHFYSGLVYPPVFGMQDAVSLQSDARFILSCVLLALCILGLGLSTYFAFMMKHKNSGLFALIFLCLCGYTQYGVLHRLFSLSVRPWYALELFFLYAMSALLILLLNRLLRPGHIPELIIGLAAGLFSLTALLYSWNAGSLSTRNMQAFSSAVVVYKLLVVCYLLWLCLGAIMRGNKNSAPVFFASLVYASAYLWDRILPSYEPIYGGWFYEWGGIVIVIAAGRVLLREITSGYRLSILQASEMRQMQNQLEMQREHYRQIEEKVEESRRLRHDFRQHLRTIISLADDKDAQLRYVNQITDVSESTRVPSYSGNYTADAILYYYDSLSRKNGITFTTRMQLPEQLPMQEVEFCAILGNLSENAVEACLRLPEGAKEISVSAKCKGDWLYLVIQNPYDGNAKEEQGIFLSRKRKGPGVGLNSVNEIVRRHDGQMRIRTEGGVFRVELALSMKASPANGISHHG